LEQEDKAMMTDAITNPIVKAAIAALQDGDKNAWSSLFTDDAKLFDDGQPRNLKKFSEDALGHERFRSIDRVEDGGLSIEGDFHSDTWGDFRTYFRFTLNAGGKIVQLEIGQAG
jgi:hypothetical protein